MHSIKVTTALIDDVYVSGFNYTSSSIQLDDSWDPALYLKLTNDDYEFLMEPLMQVHISYDNTTWHDWGGYFHGVITAGGVASWGAVKFPTGVPYARVYVASGGLYGVTARAEVVETTSLTNYS